MRIASYLEALRSSPVKTVIELTGGLPVVILSPHPDDETLGAGGLIAELCASGQRVEVVIVTDGSGSHPRSREYPKQKLVNLRYAEVHTAGLALGLSPGRVTFLGLPDTMAPKSGPEFDAAVQQVSEIVRRAGAGTLLVTWEGDPHCDHAAAAELAKAVANNISGLRLWAYPIWGWHANVEADTDLSAPHSIRIDISDYRDCKLAAIRAHASQMTDLISDDPDGFRFDNESLAPFLGQFEYFIQVPV